MGDLDPKALALATQVLWDTGDNSPTLAYHQMSESTQAELMEDVARVVRAYLAATGCVR